MKLLLQALIAAGFTVTLEAREGATSGKPASAALMERLVKGQHPVKVLIRAPDGKTAERTMSAYVGIDLEKILEQMMARDFPKAKAYLKWRQETGHAVVRLTHGALPSLGEVMHTGLRKLLDTQLSSLTWKAIRALANEDFKHLCDETRNCIKEAFAESAPPTRYSLAGAVMVTVRETLDEMLYGERQKDRRSRRTDAEILALEMLALAARMTSMEEWMWGWLGFVVEDAPQERVRVASRKPGRRVLASSTKRTRSPRAG